MSESQATKPGRESSARPAVYICSPYAGDVKANVGRACRYARFALSKGKNPIVPHLHYPQFMDDDDPEQRAAGLGFAIIWLALCDEIWVFGDTISKGMELEMAEAAAIGMKARRFDAQCNELAGEAADGPADG